MGRHGSGMWIRWDTGELEAGRAGLVIAGTSVFFGAGDKIRNVGLIFMMICVRGRRVRCGAGHHYGDKIG
jgi:hypothetical protein